MGQKETAEKNMSYRKMEENIKAAYTEKDGSPIKRVKENDSYCKRTSEIDSFFRLKFSSS